MNYDGSITIKTQLDNKDFHAQINKLEDELETLIQEQSAVASASPYAEQQKHLLDYADKISKVNNRLIELNKKQAEINRTDLTNVENSIKKVGDATNNVIGKIGKWALAIFSVRTAYGAISSAMSTLSQHDEQLKTDLEFIKYSVAVALKPVIEFIVNLAYKLLGVVRAIGLALFNFDIFSNATAENFKKIQGNASKLKKTLAGFDEMNILNSASTGGGGGTSPSGDIKISDNVVKQIEKIKKTYKEMEEALSNPKQFQETFGAWGKTIEGITRIFYSLYQDVDGISKMIVGIFTGDGTKIKEGFKLLVEGIWNGVLGLAQTINGIVLGLGYEIYTALCSIFSFLATAFYNLFIKPFIQGFKDIINAISNFGSLVNKYVIKPIKNYFDGLWSSLKKDGIKGLINYFISCWESAINWVGKNFTKMLNKLSFTNPITGEKVGVDIKYKAVSLPRLAKGTILNNPGQGVLVGGRAIAGEAGREAYLPLSDTQLLEELGSTIGKYITINANITNSMNGRIISRELKRINANDNFAMNSR